MRLGRFAYVQFLLAALMVSLLACSDDNPTVVRPCDEQSEGCGDAISSSSRQSGPDPESSSDSHPIFIQNDDQYTGFYKEDGYEAFRKLSYTSKTEMGASYLVKILISDFGTDSAEVHFMNSKKFFYHYDFAEMVLGETRSLAVFNQETYFSAEKNTVAGTLAYYASVDSMIALTFFPTDYITPVQVAAVYKLVQERLLFLNSKGAKNRLFYMPAGSTAERAAAEYANEFKKADILVFTHAELFGDIPYQIMNTGTAYGTLRKLTAAELDTAIVSSHDILILETLPAEIPLVAATITKDAQTPLSHVNLAAQARKTPNIAFNGNELPDSLLALCGKLVKLDVKANSYTVGEASLEEAQAFWNKNVRNPIKLTYDLSDSGFIDFANLNFKSSKSVGVKAANLAELHKLLPENSPDGFAVPFYHYSHFMDYAQVTEELCGRSFEDCGKEGRASEICTQVKNACISTLRQAQSAVSREAEPAVAPRVSLRGYITMRKFVNFTAKRVSVCVRARIPRIWKTSTVLGFTSPSRPRLAKKICRPMKSARCGLRCGVLRCSRNGLFGTLITCRCRWRWLSMKLSLTKSRMALLSRKISRTILWRVFTQTFKWAKRRLRIPKAVNSRKSFRLFRLRHRLVVCKVCCYNILR